MMRGLRSAFIVTAMLFVSSQIFSQEFTDSSGEVIVRVSTSPCVWGYHPIVTLSVDTDFVLVGGGAEVAGLGNPGALLISSYPDVNLSTWNAASKDHQSSYYHCLRAYAIGLRLAGVSSTELRNYMVLVDQPSTASSAPSAIASLPPGYQLIGGGAKANGSPQKGLLLTASYPKNVFQWEASAKDHNVYESGTVNAYAIGITSGVIPGFGSLSVSYNNSFAHAYTGYTVQDILVPTGWALSSVGGQATYYYPEGRLLTQLFPYSTSTRPGGRATSKDHFVVSDGYTYVHVVSIKKQ